MTADRPLLGIALMIGFCVVAPMGDSIAKLLGGTVPLGQLVTMRFVVQAIVLFPIIWILGKSLRMSRRNYWLTFIRTMLHILGIGAMFLSLQYLPLADAVAIAFVMPFIMLLLGKVYLNEEVGSRRLMACAVGFIGTLFVVQPSFAEVGLPALLPIFVAVTFAFFMLVTRKLAKATDPIALQCVSGIMASIMLLPVLAIASRFDWAALAPINPGPGLGVAVCAGRFGHDRASLYDVEPAVRPLCHACPDAIFGNSRRNDHWVGGVQGIPQRPGIVRDRGDNGCGVVHHLPRTTP